MAEVFRLAVSANVTHGLPLNKAERQAAAARIIRSHPQASDRSIAQTTGLAAKTVARIRRRSHVDETDRRVGQDGRVRPLNTADGRRIASRAITDRPDASLREIAQEAGISIGTVRNVRARLEAGEDPVPDPGRRRRDIGVCRCADGRGHRMSIGCCVDNRISRGGRCGHGRGWPGRGEPRHAGRPGWGRCSPGSSRCARPVGTCAG